MVQFNNPTIFLAGGGTGGATAPVLAVGEELRVLAPGAKIYLVGNKGIEKNMLDKLRPAFGYLSIPAGKWRRYFSLMNLVDMFKIAAGFIKSFLLISKYQPDVIFGAGSFVQVPLSWAAYFRRVPVVIHQPDFEVLLSTRLAAPVASAITMSFSGSEKDLPEFSGLFKKIKKSKVHVTGNPVRKEIFGGTRGRANKIFDLQEDFPVILIIGGSQGARRLNEVVTAAAPELVKYMQIIHIKGEKGGKGVGGFKHAHYHEYEYLGTDLRQAYAAADLVVCRAGISTITELSALGKPAIVVPLPHSPQETNAELLAQTRSAVVVFEEFFNPVLLIKLVRKIMWNAEAVRIMKENIQSLLPRDADKKIAKIILHTCDRK